MVIFFASYFLGINLLSAYLMYLDKQRAVNKGWRVPESNLLFLCLSGGFLGTFSVMKFARHKTRHWQFHAAVIVAALIWLIAIPLFWFLSVRNVI